MTTDCLIPNASFAKISGNFEGPPDHDPWECNTGHLNCQILRVFVAMSNGDFETSPRHDPWECNTQHLYCLIENEARAFRKNNSECTFIMTVDGLYFSR